MDEPAAVSESVVAVPELLLGRKTLDGLIVKGWKTRPKDGTTPAVTNLYDNRFDAQKNCPSDWEVVPHLE